MPPQALGVFLPAWQGVRATRGGGAGGLRGVDGVARAVEQLAGAVVPASALETWLLPSRVADYSPALLDELTAAGEVVWAGHGALAGHDGLVSLHPAAVADLTLPALAADEGPPDPVRAAVLEALSGGGAWFLPALAARVADLVAAFEDAVVPSPARVLDELWALVWAGLVTNDGLAPLRAWLGAGSTAHRTRTPTPRSRAVRPRLGLRGPGALPVAPCRLRGRPGHGPRRRPLVPAARARARPDSARPRHGGPAAGPARDRHPGDRAQRGARRAVRGRVPGARGPGAGRTGAARVLRRAPRRVAVRAARRGGPAAGRRAGGRSGRRRGPRRTERGPPAPSPWWSCSPRPIRPTPTARPWPGRTRGCPRVSSRDTGPAGRPAPWWCSSTAHPPSTSSVAGAPR